MRTLHRLPRPAVALAALMLPFTAASVAFAQTSTAAKARPATAFPVPPTRADRPPYTDWTRHLCTASDAIVSVQTTVRRQNTGENVVQKGVGVLVRCDGLVLIPSTLLHLAPLANESEAKNPTRVVEITITLPDRLVEKGETVRVTVPEPRFATRAVPYVLVKIRDRHLRGVPLLYPGAIEGERRVQVLLPGSEGEGSQGRGELVRVNGRVHRRGDSANAPCNLVLDENAASQKLSAGAVVMDTETGMALGMIAPGWGEEPSLAAFTTFAHLHEITNAVGMVTVPDNRIAEERADKLPAPGEKRGNMIWIPGGAVAVDPVDFPDGVGAIVACSPGYWIDEVEVTVGEYRAFLSATKYRPLPARWQEGDILGGKNAHFQDDIPVHGITSADAEAYARWAGKRLATLLEWQHASRGVGMSPMGQLPGFSTIRTPNKYQNLSPLGLPMFTRQSPDYPFPFPSLEGISGRTDAWQTAYEAALSVTESRLRFAMLDCLLLESFQWNWIMYGPDSNIDRPIVTPGHSTKVSVRMKSTKVPYTGIWSQMTPSQAVQSPTILETLIDSIRQFQGTGHLSGTDIANGDGGRFTAGSKVENGLFSGLMFIVIVRRHWLMEQVRELFQDAFGCIALSPVGANIYDLSIFGVRDMGTGVSEFLQGNQAYRKIEQANKLIRPLFDPEVTPDWRDTWHDEIAHRIATYDVQLSGSDNYNYTSVASQVAWLPGNERLLDRSSPGPNAFSIPVLMLKSDIPATMQRLNAYPTPLLPILPLSKMSEAPDLGVGFRCVR